MKGLPFTYLASQRLEPLAQNLKPSHRFSEALLSEASRTITGSFFLTKKRMKKHHALNPNTGGHSLSFTHIVRQTGEIRDYRDFFPLPAQVAPFGMVTELGNYRPDGWFKHDEITLTVGPNHSGYQFAALRIWNRPLASMHASLSPECADFTWRKAKAEHEHECAIARELLTKGDAIRFCEDTKLKPGIVPPIGLVVVSNLYPVSEVILNPADFSNTFHAFAPCLFWFLLQRHSGVPSEALVGA